MSDEHLLFDVQLKTNSSIFYDPKEKDWFNWETPKADKRAKELPKVANKVQNRDRFLK